MTSQNRRHFIKSIAAVSAASAAASSPYIQIIQQALAMPANNATGTIADVEHIVILMQENRSFDHYFGTMAGVRGFGDPFTQPLPDNRSIWEQAHTETDQPRIVMPFHLSEEAGNAQRADSTPHSAESTHLAWDDGKKDCWPNHKTQNAMGYYTERELPVQFALAKAFTICDAYFSSLNSPTGPNRIMLWTGNSDPFGQNGGPAYENAFMGLGPSSEGYSWTTYPERLEAAGVSWKVYVDAQDYYEDNPLVGFRAYRHANEAVGNASDGSPYPAYRDSDNEIDPLYKGVANTMPHGGMLETFKADVAAGRLPAVSWIVAPEAYCEHPAESAPVQGAWYTMEVLKTLVGNPDIWRKTAMFVMFDENDGYFDHLPQPGAPSFNPDRSFAGASTEDTRSEYFDVTRVTGLGPRVPMTVISPWSCGGWVNSEVFDHTSVIRFMEKRFGVEEPQISAYRRAITGDLTSCFDFSGLNEAPAINAPALDRAQADALTSAQAAQPYISVPSVAQQTLPRQLPGILPSRALPYALHVDATVAADRGSVTLMFRNIGTQAAVFHVCDKRHLDQIPRRYTVGAGRQLAGEWSIADADEGHYDLWVLGPNGFHRAFSGRLDADLSQPSPEIRISYDIASNCIIALLDNTGGAPCEFHAKANAYAAPAPQTATVVPGGRTSMGWSVSQYGNWYDFTVDVPRLAGFQRRFAGRIENGRDLISDPAMGLPRT